MLRCSRPETPYPKSVGPDAAYYAATPARRHGAGGEGRAIACGFLQQVRRGAIATAGERGAGIVRREALRTAEHQKQHPTPDATCTLRSGAAVGDWTCNSSGCRYRDCLSMGSVSHSSRSRVPRLHRTSREDLACRGNLERAEKIRLRDQIKQAVGMAGVGEVAK